MLVQEAARQWFITQEARTVYNTLVPFTTAAAAVVYSLMASVTRTNKNEQKRWQTLIYMLNPVSGGYEATYHSCLSDSAVVQLNSWRCPWKSRTNFIRPLYAPIRNYHYCFPFCWPAVIRSHKLFRQPQRSLSMLSSKLNLCTISLLN